MSAPSPLTKSDADKGFGCLFIFGAIFFLAGAGAFIASWSSPESDGRVAGLGVGGLFAAVGLGIIAMGVFGRRATVEQATLSTRHPDEPWLWRADWSKGKVESGGAAELWTVWAFAGFWNAIALPGLWLGREELLAKDWPILAVISIFPIVGFFLLVWAIRVQLRYLRYGVSTLRLDTLPGVVGGKLRGTLYTKIRRRPDDGVRLCLQSFRRTRQRSGKNTSVQERLLWEHEETVPASYLSRGPGGISLPVEFAVPSTCEPTTAGFSTDGVVWRLSVNAATPGLDYQTSFEVPVFRTGDSRTDAEEAASGSESIWGVRAAPGFDLSKATFRDRPGPTGGRELYFPPARNPGTASALTFFTLLWFGAIAFMTYVEAPTFLPIIFGLIGLLLLWAVLEMWLGRYRIVIDGGRIRTTHSLIFSASKSWAFSEIESISAHVGMTQSPSATQAAKAWYDVRLKPYQGRQVALVSSIRSKTEAHWLAAELEKLAGIERRPKSSA